MRSEKLTINELFHNLCRHLTAYSNLTQVSQTFMELQTNWERVDFATNLLNSFGNLPVYDTTSLKNNEMSIQFREQGNIMFKDKQYDYALELYTKSITYAETGSEILGLAYANRSAVLFEKKMFRECLEDIDKAFTSNYPEANYSKLLRRRQRSEKELTQCCTHEEPKYYEELPEFIHDVSPTIACASNCIAITTNAECGRHVVATKDIQIGDVIAIDTPYAAIVVPEASITHCHHCLKVVLNSIPCQKCSYAIYCSVNCSDSAQYSYHQYECPVISVLLNLNVSKLNLLALRIAILAKKDYKKIPQYGKSNSVYESARYEEIHGLCANTEHRTNADLFDRAIQAAVIFDIFNSYSTFFQDFGEESDVKMFKELLLLHMQTGPSNFHEISELVRRTEDSTAESLEIGAGAYSFLSMINHSCSPNVVRHCYGKSIVLRALSPIKEGQQLFDNYGYHYAVMERSQRQKSLKLQYFFDCSCEACTDCWPLYKYLPDKNFEFDLSCDIVNDLQQAMVSTARSVLKGLLIKAAILEKLKPCKNLADIQECIKQCYSILANKRLMPKSAQS